MTTLEGRKVALIGGAGFIGHHLALALVKQGAQVHVVDGLAVNNFLYFAETTKDIPSRDLYIRIITQRLDLLKQANVSLHVQDARDYLKLGKVLWDIKPQTIVHLAAVSHAGRANKDPYSTFDHSLRTLENALDYSRDNIEHFVYFSSSMVYGDFLTEKVTEEHPLNSIGIYGALKVAGEKMVIAYNQVYNLPYTIVRPSALYGPRCVSRRVGQIFIESAIEGGCLRVDGDGKERLDFTCVDDLIAGVLLVIENPASRNQIFNLTYGQSRSINELVEVIRQYFPESAIQYVERDRLMPHRGTLSVKKAKEMLAYDPQNPIEVGFPKYIQWYRELDPSGRFWVDIKVNL